MDLNRLLDRLPRRTVTVGARVLPAFRSIGVLGFHVAVLVALLTGFRAGVEVPDTLAIAAVAAASLFAWGLLRRALTGRESLVLMESVAVAFAAVAGLRWAAGTPLLPGLDVLAVALCPFLAAGRLGCLTAGCCHGHPAPIGVAYPGLSPRLTGVRLFPVPLVEAAALAAIGVAGFALAAGPPGTATAWFLAAYATVRFGTEALRGDRRPAVLGVCVTRLACAAQLAAAAWLGAVIVPGGTRRSAAVAASVLVAAGAAGVVLSRRRRDPLAAPGHLDETWDRIVALARCARTGGASPATAETSQGLRLAASWSEHGLHVSFSHPGRPVTGLPRALGLIPLVSTGVAVHAVVSPTRLPDRVTPGRNRMPGRYHVVEAPDSLDNGTGGDYFGDRSGV
ncbi:prolipoprotein diacylglyceryl transferase family protein [Paractinoplanes deccanensis]|nr:prolipoprotein diacylglyceryl transferase family protein [Actinoplanes deccanensis]